MVLLEAGHEATVNTLGNGFRALMHHPDQWRRLDHVARSSRAAAVEELLRWDSPLQMFERWVLDEGVEIAGQEIGVGQEVAMLFGSAQRDPRRFDDPTVSTSAATTPLTSDSVAASTSASARRSPVWSWPHRSPVSSDRFPDLVASQRAALPPDLRHPRPHRAPPDASLTDRHRRFRRPNSRATGQTRNERTSRSRSARVGIDE